MSNKNKKITKEQLRKLAAGARRTVDIEEGIGLNRKSQVFSDKKKQDNKDKCRKKVQED